MELTNVLHAGTNSCKLKGVWKFWGGVGIVKNGCGWSGEETLKLTGSEEWTDGITDFLHVGTDSQKLKADQKFFGWAWSAVSVASLAVGL